METLMKGIGRREWSMERVDIFGQIKLSMKVVFGLTRDKVKERFNIQATVDIKDTGEMIKEKERGCCSKTMLPSEFLTDF